MKKLSIITSFFLILAIVFYGLFIISENNKCSSVRAYFCQKQQAPKNISSSGNIATNSWIIQNNIENNIILISPVNNGKISWNVEIKWKARVFENTFNYRILDSSWNTVKEWAGTTNAKDTWLFWDFDIKVDFKNPISNTWSIEVFQTSPKDWSEVDKVVVGLIFLK